MNILFYFEYSATPFCDFRIANESFKRFVLPVRKKVFKVPYFEGIAIFHRLTISRLSSSLIDLHCWVGEIMHKINNFETHSDNIILWLSNFLKKCQKLNQRCDSIFWKELYPRVKMTLSVVRKKATTLRFTEISILLMPRMSANIAMLDTALLQNSRLTVWKNTICLKIRL